MAERLTDAQLRNQRAQALRAVRRKQRTLDTLNEVMERRMDRAIENKERITIRLMKSISLDYRKLVKAMQVLEQSVTDAIQIFLD